MNDAVENIKTTLVETIEQLQEKMGNAQAREQEDKAYECSVKIDALTDFYSKHFNDIDKYNYIFTIAYKRGIQKATEG